MHALFLQVDVRQLKYYFMEDSDGGLLLSNVHPEIKAAVTKVSLSLALLLCLPSFDLLTDSARVGLASVGSGSS